jgi:hypothetical protein
MAAATLPICHPGLHDGVHKSAGRVQLFCDMLEMAAAYQ